MDLELAEYLLAAIAGLAIIAGAVLEFRRDGARMRDLEIRMAVVERRLELSEIEDVYEGEKDGD